MASSNLQQCILHPELLSKDTLYELRNLLIRYPYCQSLRLMYLKNLYVLHDAGFGAELRKSAIYIPDRRVLFYLIEGHKYTLSQKKSASDSIENLSDEPELDRTLSLIDAFLSTIPEEASLQNSFDYATDYTAYLTQNEEKEGEAEKEKPEEPQLHRHDLIDNFIEKADVIKLQSREEEEPSVSEGPDLEYHEIDDDDNYFTETLAKIYIKQQRYSKALEIIKKLSLKYPKKNAYFADQIRFLEKLIINANSK